MSTCLHCGTKTTNPKFCSKNCAAKMNNKLHPKRSLTNTCKSCSKPIASDRTYCQECYQLKKVDYNSLTLKQLEQDKGSRNRYATVVRSHSRSVLAKVKERKCQICGYSTYVECCHIKPVSSFDLSTTLSIVNSPDNLIWLCPNHHKELDLGLLNLTS